MKPRTLDAAAELLWVRDPEAMDVLVTELERAVSGEALRRRREKHPCSYVVDDPTMERAEILGWTRGTVCLIRDARPAGAITPAPTDEPEWTLDEIMAREG